MKVLVVFAFTLACASAYNGPQHHAVIGKDGVPIDTVEVQHARAAHLSQLAAASHNDAHSDNNADFHTSYTGPLYHGPQHIPVIGKNGVPVDTVEVQHARSAHLAQFAAAKAHDSFQHTETPVYVHKEEYSEPFYHGPLHIPVINKHGVPVETVEVQHAKAAHLSATKLAASKSQEYEHHSYEKFVPIVSHNVEHTKPAYHGPQHIAVIGKNGVPVDTAEVQHARAAHLAAYDSQKHH